jgi:hypothetical protein
MTTPEPLITLEQACELIPTATPATLKRQIRQGKLWASKPGKRYLTTAAAVRELVVACRVEPKAQDYGCDQRDMTLLESSPTPLHMSFLMDPGKLELAAAKAHLLTLKRR